MKNYYIYLLIFLVGPFTLLAQTKVQGLGRFKIGKTTLDSLSDLPTKKIINKSEMVGVGQKLVELTPNLENPAGRIDRASDLSDLKVLFSDQYTESGLMLKNVYLFFYQGLLYKIECDYTDQIKQTMYLKYGQPKITKTKFPAKCTNRSTERLVDDSFNESTLAIWSNLPINAIYYTYQGYNSNCEASHREFFLLEDTSKTEEIIARGKAAEKDKPQKKE